MLFGKADILEGMNPLGLEGRMLAFSEQIRSLGMLMDPDLLFKKIGWHLLDARLFLRLIQGTGHDL